MKSAYRYDKGTVELLPNENGFLRARVTIARDGVFPYLRPDGTITMEAKLEEELFSDFTISTARGVPVADGHPPLSDNQGLISPENYRNHMKGVFGDPIVVEDGLLTGTEIIFDSALIADIKSGKKAEASIGFKTDIEQIPGEYKGVRYDAIQRNIRINHVAHVPRGRAGSDVRTHLDEGISSGMEIAVMHDAIMQNDSNRRDEMTVKNAVKHDEKSFLDAMRNFVALFAPTKNRRDADDLEAATETISQAVDEIKNTPDPASPEEAGAMAPVIAALRGQIEALNQLLEEKTRMLNEALSPAVQDAAIARRLELIDSARSVIDGFKHDGLSEREIKLKVIEKALPFRQEIKVDSLNDARIDAQYDAAMSLLREKAALRVDHASPTGNRIDEAEIEKKRQARLNLCN